MCCNRSYNRETHMLLVFPRSPVKLSLSNYSLSNFGKTCVIHSIRPIKRELHQAVKLRCAIVSSPKGHRNCDAHNALMLQIDDAAKLSQ